MFSDRYIGMRNGFQDSETDEILSKAAGFGYYNAHADRMLWQTVQKDPTDLPDRTSLCSRVQWYKPLVGSGSGADPCAFGYRLGS